MSQSFQPSQEQIFQQQRSAAHDNDTSFDPQQYERQYHAQWPGDIPSSPEEPQQVPPMQAGPGQQVPLYTYGYVPLYATTPPPIMGSNVFGQMETPSAARLGGVLSYLGGWFTAILMILFVKQNRFVRFHAMQSLLFFGGYTFLFIVSLRLISLHITLIRYPVIPFFVMLNVIAFVGWIVGLIGALSGKYIGLPFVSEWAHRFARDRHKPGTVK
ncbi:DUF4870 domain-containing protein [Dictyobacter arantiisoli]|uniref:DUF4870 domain-containing protein n=1 Tax=Dictyobacter arantiisoli TaxID=2014874 RepID=A0A5A5TDF8_9CHLR|nr:hypothetical protein [Dictyobacter arantiisoli]GCF09083.1 hypothetical protein KDI_26470 [Dictyobacter arantiisoli]